MVAANVGVWAFHENLPIAAFVARCNADVAAITIRIDIRIIQLPLELAAEHPVTKRIRVGARALRHYLKEIQVVPFLYKLHKNF